MKSVLNQRDTLETKNDNHSSCFRYPYPESAFISSPLVYAPLASALILSPLAYSNLASAPKTKKPATFVAGFDYAMDFLLKQLALGLNLVALGR